jgi:hypothetical protein
VIEGIVVADDLIRPDDRFPPAFRQWVESSPMIAADAMRLRSKPNRPRIALDSFWNYQQIDTDRIPPDTGP